jgi:predicted nucleic acid-binding protein
MDARAFAHQLDRYRKVAIDLGPFQLYLQGDERFEPLTLALFERIERGALEGVASDLTLMELLVEPHRRRDEAAVMDYAFLLPTFPHLDWVPVDRAIAQKAAQWRARHDLEVLEAVAAATAAEAGAEALVTNSERLKRLSGEIDIIFLGDCL